MNSNQKNIVLLVISIGMIIALASCSSRKNSPYASGDNVEIDSYISNEISDLSSNNANIRLHALNALGSQGQSASRALPIINNLIENDQVYNVRKSAVYAYAKINSDFLNKLEIPIDVANNETLEINIDPKYDQYFDGYQSLRNVLRYGFLPIHFEIKNNSKRSIRIDFNEALFENSRTGETCTPVPLNRVLRSLKFSVAKGVVTAIILPFTIASPFKRGVANARTSKFIRESILKSELIPPFASRGGDLFFPMTIETANMNGWKISFTIFETINRNKFNISHVYNGKTIIDGSSANNLSLTKDQSYNENASEKQSAEERLLKINELFKKGLISESEYKLKKSEIINEL